MRAPVDDFTLSPHTGWTRRHWEALADRLVTAVWRYADGDHALPRLPGPVSRNGRDSDALEAFARSLQLAAIRLAGGGEDRIGAIEWYARGLATGTDPDSPSRWPAPREVSQAKVEAASIALSLMLTDGRLWRELSPVAHRNTMAWFEQVIGTWYPPINWVWFQLLVEAFLRQVGGRWSTQDIADCLSVHEGLYESDGWYRDGPDRAYDHYCGWALQVYPALLGRLAPDLPGVAALVPRWQERLRRYLDDAIRLIGADGSPLLQGRSLIYRFGVAGPIWAGALTGASGLSPGLTRRAASGIVRHFVDAGVPGDDGLLTVGWHHSFPAMRQSYSGAGSPYWASIGMLGLLLPADHPVWTEAEEPLPVERGDVSAMIRAPGWLVSGTRADGVIRIINHGTDHASAGAQLTDSPWYARLAYSTATSADCVGADDVADPLDNAVVLLDQDGRASCRTGFVTLHLDVHTAVSRSRAHWVTGLDPDTPDHGSGFAGTVTLGPWLTVGSVLRGAVEVRAVRVDPVEPYLGWRLRVSGWPVGVGRRRPLTGAVRPLDGCAPADPAHLPGGLTVAGVFHRSGANPLAPATATAWVATDGPAQPGRVYLAAVVLTGTPGTATVGAGALAADAVDLPRVTVRPAGAGDRITVDWPHGETDLLVLPPPG